MVLGQTATVAALLSSLMLVITPFAGGFFAIDWKSKGKDEKVSKLSKIVIFVFATIGTFILNFVVSMVLIRTIIIDLL